MRDIQAVFTIAFRDWTKLLRDRPRLLASFIFPVVFIGILGGSLQANLGPALGYNYLTFVFIGVLAQTLFQSTAAGIISLIEDRENDFSQEIFVAPISRYTIVIGKIIGETLVSLTQSVSVLIFGLVLGVPLTLLQVLAFIPIAVIICFFGGTFGLLIMTNLRTQRAANQIFPFVIFPQFFLAGVFNPIINLPPLLFILSRLAPMTYAVDLLRSIYYFGAPEYEQVVLHNPALNLAIIAVVSTVFIVAGTYLFVRNERNR